MSVLHLLLVWSSSGSCRSSSSSNSSSTLGSSSLSSSSLDSSRFGNIITISSRLGSSTILVAGVVLTFIVEINVVAILAVAFVASAGKPAIAINEQTKHWNTSTSKMKHPFSKFEHTLHMVLWGASLPLKITGTPNPCKVFKQST